MEETGLTPTNKGKTMANKGQVTYHDIPGVRVKYNPHITPSTIDVYEFKPDGEFSVTVLLTEHQKDYLVRSGVPEESMGNIMFKKDEETGMFLYKFKRPNIQNGVEWGPPDVYNKEATMRKSDSAESTQWWRYMVPWVEEKDGQLADGSLIDVGFTIWQSEKNPKIKSVKLTRVGVIEAVVLDQAAA